MSGKRGPEDFFAELDDVQRRLRALETAPRLTSASIKNVLIQILDDSGNIRAKFGKITANKFGLQVVDSSGNERLMLGQIGASSYGTRIRDDNGAIVNEASDDPDEPDAHCG